MNEEIYAAAAQWHQTQADDSIDWDAFTLWLEADDRHRVAYDEMALLDELIDRAAPLLTPSSPAGPAPMVGRGWRWAMWGTAAAAVAATIGISAALRPDAPTHVPTVHAAKLGELRTVALATGSRATLSPGTTLRTGGDGMPMLLDGHAYFNVRHDPANPLTIQAAGYLIRDVGTRFDVTTGAGMLRVSVAEGEVAVSTPTVSGEVRVAAGRSLTAFGGSRAIQLGTAQSDAVGYRPSRGLVYANMPVALVAADLSRYAGTPIIAAPDVARRPFSGVIRPGDARSMAGALAELTGLEVQKASDAIRLVRATSG